MSGALPNTDFESVKITSNTPTMITTAVSGIRQAKQVASQFWTIEANYRPLTSREAKTIQGFIAKQRGSLYDFTVIIPTISTANGDINLVRAANPSTSDTMVTTANAALGTNSIAFDTAFNSSLFAPAGGSATRGLQAGDYIKFAGHTKVYQIIEDVSFGATGGGTFTIFPNLMSAVTNGEQIIYNSVPFTVFNTETGQDVSFSIGDEVAISLKLQESL
jgi:hypothetical protein